jgi:hypothetical protein
MNTALEYSTRVVQEGGRRCKKSTLNDLVHLTPLGIPLMNPPLVSIMTHLPPPPPSSHLVHSLSRYFGRKVQLGLGKQTAKTWFGLEK